VKKLAKKLSLRKETLLSLRLAVGGTMGDVYTDTDGDTFPSGGPVICYISNCNPCETQIICPLQG